MQAPLQAWSCARAQRHAAIAILSIAVVVAIGATAFVALRSPATAAVAEQPNASVANTTPRTAPLADAQLVGASHDLLSRDSRAGSAATQAFEISMGCVELAGLCQPVRIWQSSDAPGDCVELAGLCQPVHTR